MHFFFSDTLLLAHWDIGLISVLLKENSFFFSKSPVFLRDLTRPCSLLRFCIHSNAVIKYSKNKSNIKDMYLSFAQFCEMVLNIQSN